MSRRASFVLLLGMSAGLVLAGCSSTRPVETPQLSVEDVAKTVVVQMFETQTAAAPLVVIVTATQPPLDPSATASSLPCQPIVTATTSASVRWGDSTEHDVVAVLAIGETAPVAGRNAAGTWWYIQVVGGGYAWVSATVVSPSCIPPEVQVVAAPPLPAEQSSSFSASESSSRQPSPTPLAMPTPLPPWAPIPAPTEQPAFDYVVAEGDTCGGIAVTFGVSVQSIIILNNLPAACDNLTVGQTLKIPY